MRALLAVFQVPRLVHAGDGWGAGKTALYRDSAGRGSFVVALDRDEEIDAREWAEALATYVNEAFDADDPGSPPPSPCAVESCWIVGGQSIAFAHRARDRPDASGRRHSREAREPPSSPRTRPRRPPTRGL